MLLNIPATCILQHPACYYWLAEACEHYTLVIHYQTRTSKQRLGQDSEGITQDCT